MGQSSKDVRSSQDERREILDILDFSLGLYVVVSKASRILYANQAMNDWLGAQNNSLCERSGRLTAAEPDWALEVRKWIAAVFAMPVSQPHVLVLERCDEPSLILRAQMVEPVETGDDPQALVAVHDALAFRSLHELSRLFELTSAERVLAEHILSGASLSDAQAELGITANTARTHLKSIYRKTGARNQVDLVRLLKDAARISTPTKEEASASVAGGEASACRFRRAGTADGGAHKPTF
jgi:DNA-binding CsgD family transcriptional regulator